MSRVLRGRWLSRPQREAGSVPASIDAKPCNGTFHQPTRDFIAIEVGIGARDLRVPVALTLFCDPMLVAVHAPHDHAPIQCTTFLRGIVADWI
jgi:hypothetical protein